LFTHVTLPPERLRISKGPSVFARQALYMVREFHEDETDQFTKDADNINQTSLA
jgi:hypothetical protein